MQGFLLDDVLCLLVGQFYRIVNILTRAKLYFQMFVMAKFMSWELDIHCLKETMSVQHTLDSG